ncbi:hypothetical protein M9458_009451, partial [Cirrhinus mrigala]
SIEDASLPGERMCAFITTCSRSAMPRPFSSRVRVRARVRACVCASCAVFNNQLQYVQKKSLIRITFDLNICSPTRKDEERYITTTTTTTTKALLPLQHTDMNVHGHRTVYSQRGAGAKS